jgi:hypothetical protein
MSLEQFIKDVMAQVQPDRLPRHLQPAVAVHVYGPVTINVNPAAERPVQQGTGFLPVPPPSAMPEAWTEGEQALQAEKERYATQTVQMGPDPADGKVPDEEWTPEAEENLKKVLIGVRGNLTSEKLVEFARDNGFSVESAEKLWPMLGRERFQDFLSDHGVTLQVGRGNGYLMSGLRKAAALKELKPNCVRGYGPRMHELLLAVTAK